MMNATRLTHFHRLFLIVGIPIALALPGFAFGKAEEMTLANGAEFKIPNTEFSIRVTKMVYSPCPRDAQCIWSGLLTEVGLFHGKDACAEPSHNAGGENPGRREFYSALPPFRTFVSCPYALRLVDTDYRTYAKIEYFKVPPQCQSAFPNTPATAECRKAICAIDEKLFQCEPSPKPTVSERERYDRWIKLNSGFLAQLFYRPVGSEDCAKLSFSFRRDACFFRHASLLVTGMENKKAECRKIQSEETRHHCMAIVAELGDSVPT